MAFHVNKYVNWKAGAGTPVKYAFTLDADVDVVSFVNNTATISVVGTARVECYPTNSRNSFAASDFAVLVPGDVDISSHPFIYGTSYYQRAIPFLPDPQNGDAGKMITQFRGDTWISDPNNNNNKVSLWVKDLGLVMNQVDQEVTSTWNINTTFTIYINETGDTPILAWDASGCNNSTDYSWLQRQVWVSWFDLDWTATVKYNANGGTGAPGDTTATASGGTQTLTLSNTVPTRTNYKFLGWSKSSSATTATYQPGGSITISKNSPTVQLYAVWEDPWTAQLKYAGQGSGLPSPQTATVDANLNSHNFIVSSTIPTRTNYRFDGWATVGGGAVAYHGGDTYTIQKSSPTKYLYAVWTPYWNATLHYDANNGSGAPADQTASVNPDYTSTTFTIPNTVPTRSMHKFLGWATSSSATTAQYQPGDTFTIQQSSPNKTLYAVWESPWTATLNYNANGGTGTPASQTSTVDANLNSYSFTVSNTAPTRTRFRFEGWANTASGAVAYHGGDTITVTKSSPTKTIYAYWTPYYRPGATYNSSNIWQCHESPNKAAHILPNASVDVWNEMITIGAPTEMGDAPSIYHDSKWYNQKKLGKEI